MRWSAELDNADVGAVKQPNVFFPSRYWTREIKEHDRAMREKESS